MQQSHGVTGVLRRVPSLPFFPPRPRWTGDSSSPSSSSTTRMVNKYLLPNRQDDVATTQPELFHARLYLFIGHFSFNWACTCLRIAHPGSKKLRRRRPKKKGAITCATEILSFLGAGPALSPSRDLGRRSGLPSGSGRLIRCGAPESRGGPPPRGDSPVLIVAGCTVSCWETGQRLGQTTNGPCVRAWVGPPRCGCGAFSCAP
ncbi:hypothetical protein BC826DRAFT_480092 [Russula brevipes]|nr:hypothetical protein BC826DRAFT_480092 [Russula brevipes]